MKKKDGDKIGMVIGGLAFTKDEMRELNKPFEIRIRDAHIAKLLQIVYQFAEASSYALKFLPKDTAKTLPSERLAKVRLKQAIQNYLDKGGEEKYL